MKHRFFIDNRYLFLPEKNTVKDTITGKETTLNTPAARCLETLLLNRRLVTHDELYKSGWSDDEKEPAPNTLYQNILLIRKAFKEVSGTNQDYIITSPRKGFIFNENSQVNIIKEQSKKSNTLADVTMALPVASDTSEVKSSRVFSRFGFLKWRYFIPTLLFILSFLLLMLFIMNMTSKNKHAILSDNFTYYKELEGCKYYVNNNMTNNFLEKKTEISAIQALWGKVTENNISCSVYPIRYVTIFEHENTVRALACSQTGDSSAEQVCITIYKRGHL